MQGHDTMPGEHYRHNTRRGNIVQSARWSATEICQLFSTGLSDISLDELT